MFSFGFEPDRLGMQELADFDAMKRACSGDVLKAVALAGSGHPGGSLSSLGLLLMVYANIRHRADEPHWDDRDRVVISHGHISAGAYSVLSRFGYFPRESLFLGFRKVGSPFSGHVESCVPGVYWNTGNLGQGLSAGAAAALAGKLRKSDYRTIVFMGDGEQQKGQIGEARRFAVKFGLGRLIAIVDYNQLQIGGAISDIMPQDIVANWRADGWNVIELLDGHDPGSVYDALRRAYQGRTDDPERPTVIIAATVMGKGVSFMENRAKYHGVALNRDELANALQELEQADDFEALLERRNNRHVNVPCTRNAPSLNWPDLDSGTPRTYEVDADTDNRTGYGNALADLAWANHGPDGPKVVGLSCDLEGSVKMNLLRKVLPDAFFESGIQEHNTAAVAGALSREGIVPFFSTFGVFGIDETYNQHRLSDINEAAPKVVLTHCGIDVGEDGPTHHCIDYVGLGVNLFDFEVFHPADPNQTDRMIRAVAGRPRPSLVCMGRSKTPVISRDDGTPFFAGDYAFQVGKADLIRPGDDLTLMSYGPTLSSCLRVSERMEKEYGLRVRVLNFATLKPIDAEAVVEAVTGTKGVVTVEDHNVNTGLGMLVAGVMVDRGVMAPLRRLGVRFYASSGSPADLYREQGFDAEGIFKTLVEMARQQGLLSASAD